LTSSFAAQTASFTAFTSSILSYTASQNILNGTYTLTSSFAAQTASFTAFTASILAQTASLNSFSASVLSYTSSLNAKTSSFATTGSNTFAGIQTINSNLIVTGSITAQTLIVSTINVTQSFSSGSNIFGNALTNTQVFSGSVSMNPGGLFVSGSGLVGIGTTSPSSKLHVVGSSLTDTFRITDASNYTIVMGYSGSANVGMISTLGSTAKLALGTNSAARLTIEGTGKVGISTSVAGDVLLNVVNGSSTGYGMNISAGSGSENYALRVENYNGASTLLYVRGDGNILINDTSANSYAKLQVTATSGVVLGLANPSAAAAGVGNVIQAWGTSGYNTLGEIDFLWDGASTTYAYMAFKTRGPSLLERMRITSGGNVLIASTSDNGDKLQVTGNTTMTANLGIGGGSESGVRLVIKAATAGSDAYAIIARTSAAGDLFVIRNDGLIYSGVQSLSPYNYGVSGGKALYVGSSGALGYNSSTRESKSNITNIENVDWLKELQPVTFNKKKKDDEGNYTEELESQLEYGLIAEDVEIINPNFVFYDKDNKLAGVHYDRLIAPILKAIQELKAEFDAYKTTHP
jgi:hypothetical protein